jgi:hypothetical protein
MRVTDLPKPACSFGYTSVQLLHLLGPDRFAELTRSWRARMVECGVGSGCGPHGVVLPVVQLKMFLVRRG